jgi:4-diphosphocytidyl-2-C-methyl-D-erythritol kinase
MGGGSADAGALLRSASRLAPIDPAVCADVARELGADVPSQLTSGLSLGTGAGEVVEPVTALAPHALVIVPLPFALSTPAVYAEADRLGLTRAPANLERWRGELRAALRSPQPLAEYLLTNDLGPAAQSLCPQISGALGAVERQAADQVLVSGSGPTVFGVFWGAAAQSRAAEAASALQSVYPDALAASPVSAEYGIPRSA